MFRYVIEFGPRQLDVSRVPKRIIEEEDQLLVVRFTIPHPEGPPSCLKSIYVVIEEMSHPGDWKEGVRFSGYIRPEKGDTLLNSVRGFYHLGWHRGDLETTLELVRQATTAAA